jgi:hypothetical protein
VIAYPARSCDNPRSMARVNVWKNWGYLALVAQLLVGCGPSFQTLHEADRRFEQCYALDENMHVSAEKKAICWTQWGNTFADGQTRDRVQYARIRRDALLRVGASPTDEALMFAAPGALGEQANPVAGPQPTSATQPPPRAIR